MAVQDSLHEYDEDVTLAFGTLPVGVNAGTTTTTTVSIIDDDGPPVDRQLRGDVLHRGRERRHVHHRWRPRTPSR